MRILMVSAFPPLRDGIGKYAAFEYAALKSEGHEVEILSPIPCAAHYVDDLVGGLRLLKIWGYARGYDRVILQYHPTRLHTRRAGLDRALTSLAMLLLFPFLRKLTVVCHEVDYPPASLPLWRPEVLFERLAWRHAREVVFHTEREVEELEERMKVRPKNLRWRRHAMYFLPHATEDSATARRKLGLGDERIILCIGFIQPHKGFDRAVKAFRRIPSPDARLYVVGSLRTETEEHRAHVEELRRLASGDPRIEVREKALSDQEFDRWILAADAVALPYREIWSSGVLERAKLLGTPALLADVGGLAEQKGERDLLFKDDEELAQAMGRVVGTAPTGVEVEDFASAWGFVAAEAARRREVAAAQVATDLEDALARMERSAVVKSFYVPSGRAFVGGLVTFAKRASGRVVRWHVKSVVDGVNQFNAAALEALKALARERKAQ